MLDGKRHGGRPPKEEDRHRSGSQQCAHGIPLIKGDRNTCVGRSPEGHRRQIAAMNLATSLRDADSDRSNVFCLGFAGFTILADFVADFLALSERSARLGQAGDMHKNITAATFWRDETETLVRIEKFYRARCHMDPLNWSDVCLPMESIECAGDAQLPRIAATRSIDH